MEISFDIDGVPAEFRRSWKTGTAEHDVEIVKVRPRMFGGIRPNSYTVSVDNIIVAKARGM
jgi:hypothetical protein